MSKSLTKCDLDLAFNVTLSNVTDQGTFLDNLQAGASKGTSDETFAKFAATLAAGVGSGNGQFFYHNRYTFAANGNTDINLKTETLDIWGAAQNFALIKIFLLRIVTPVTGRKLKLMPDATNGFNAFWEGGTTDPIVIHNMEYKTSLIDGFVVDGTHKVLRVNNPHATSAVVADLILIGE